MSSLTPTNYTPLHCTESHPGQIVDGCSCFRYDVRCGTRFVKHLSWRNKICRRYVSNPCNPLDGATVLTLNLGHESWWWVNGGHSFYRVAGSLKDLRTMSFTPGPLVVLTVTDPRKSLRLGVGMTYSQTSTKNPCNLILFVRRPRP